MDHDSFPSSFDANVGPIREVIRTVASTFAREGTYPTAEMVRKQIIKLTNGERSPSATTVQDEMKAWYADTFWPTYNILGGLDDLPALPGIARELREIYIEGFRVLVLDTVKSVKTAWADERESLLQQLAESEAVTVGLRSDLTVREQTIDSLNEKVVAVSQENVAAGQRIDEQASSIAALQQSLAEAHSLAREMAEKQAGHERELNQVRDEERARSDRLVAQAREDVRTVQLELDAQRQANKRLEQNLETQQGQLQTERARVSAAEATAAALTAELQTLRHAHAAEVQRLAESIRQLSTPAPAPERPRKALPAAGERMPRNRLRKNTLR